MKNHETLYVFDFDGTITYVDTFKIFLILRLLNPKYWIKTFLEICKLITYRNISMFRFRIQKIIWMEECDRLSFFNKIIESKFFTFLIRKDVFEYLNKLLNDNKVILITANEISLVNSFVKIFLGKKMDRIHLIGSNFEIDNSKIIKGKEKLKELEKYLKKTNNYSKIISFFDSRSDLKMSKVTNTNVVVGKFNYLLIKLFYADVRYFKDFLIQTKSE